MSTVDPMEEITVAVKSFSPYVWVRTHEESRFLADFKKQMDSKKYQVLVWSIAHGLLTPDLVDSCEESKNAKFKGTKQPEKAINAISNFKVDEDKYRGLVVVLRDPMMILQGPVVRHLRDLYTKLRNDNITIMCLSSRLAHGPGGKTSGLPPEMSKEFVVCDYGLPGLELIETMARDLVRETVESNQPRPEFSDERKKKCQEIADRFTFTPEEYTAFARALQGLTHHEVEVALSSSVHTHKTLDLPFLLNTKKQIVSRSDILEFHSTPKSMDDIGGMDLAKEFFDDYKFAHTKEAQEFGVTPLKGILLVGIPGCGKSQLSKAIATNWNLPLLRMDIGRVMTGLVGGSESRMREAIQQVEAVSPCVLWIDEVEKALSGTKSSNFSDGGTMARVFGTLLTAMEEGLDGVTIVATANDISALPPEFIRRFDEVFFVDLPSEEERAAIFEIHQRLKGFGDTQLDMKALVDASQDYTGHEIEKAVKRGIAFAFKDDDRTLKTEHVVKALEDTKPLSFTMGEKIASLREKANGRFRYASSDAQTAGAKLASKKETMKLDDLDLPDMEKREGDGKGPDLDLN